MCSGGSMDHCSGSGYSNPAAVTASVKSLIARHQLKLATETQSQVVIREKYDYSVADLFGRWFLRLCYWVDVFSSMRRRGETMPDLPLTRAKLVSQSQPAKLITAQASDPASGVPIANA